MAVQAAAVNHLHARCMRSSSTNLRSLVMRQLFRDFSAPARKGGIRNAFYAGFCACFDSTLLVRPVYLWASGGLFKSLPSIATHRAQA